MSQSSNSPVLVFLFAQSPDKTQLSGVEEENEIVNDLLLTLFSQGSITLHREWSVKRKHLTKVLQQFKDRISILHFGGHANGEGLYMEDGQALATGLADLLHLQQNIKLVFLNGCHTWAQAKLFTEAGVPVVIATNQAIPDTQATLFSKEFYGALTRNHDIANAYKSAAGALKTNEHYEVSVEDTIVHRGIILRKEGPLDKAFPWLLCTKEESTDLSWKLPQLQGPVLKSEEISSIAAINFLSKEGKELLPEDLLQEDRSLEFELRDEYYFKRSTDDNIFKHLSKQRGILLNSLPLNGKTTTVYKLLKDRFPDSQVHIADGWKLSVESKIWDEGLNLLRENIEQIGATFHSNFFVFDDVVQYFGHDEEKHQEDKAKEFRQILKKILKNKRSTIILICQTDQVDQVTTKLEGCVGGTLISPCKLPELKEEEMQGLLAELLDHKIKPEINSSTVIGHYFIGLERFRQEYNQLTNEQKEFLWCYKCNYFIREFADRDNEKILLQYYQLQHQGKAVAEVEEIIEGLTKNGILKRETFREKNEEGDEIITEKLIIKEFWLEKIILHEENIKRTGEEYLTEKIQQEIAENEETHMIRALYAAYANSPAEERLNIYNRIMLRVSHNYNEIKRDILERMEREGLRRDVFTFNVLIYRSNTLYPAYGEDNSNLPNQNYAGYYYDQMIKEYKIEPNAYTLNFLIRKCPHHSKALEYYREIIDTYEVDPDEYTFRGLLAVSSNFLEAWSSYELFRSINELEADRYLNPSIYYNLLGHAESFTDAYRIYLSIQEVNQAYIHRYPEREMLIQPNAAFYKSIIRKPGGSFDDAWELFLQAKKLDERGIDFYVLTCLIKKCSFYWQAQQVIEVINGLKVKQLQPTFFNNLMKVVHDQKERQEIFKRMESLEVKPSKESYNTLMQLATLDEAKSIFSEMINKGVRVDTYSFYHLIRKEVDFAAKWSRFVSMNEEDFVRYNLKPTITVINYLLGEMKAALDPDECHEKAEVLFQIIKTGDLLQSTWNTSSSASNAVEKIRGCYYLIRGKLPTVDRKIELIELMTPFLSIVDSDFEVVVSKSENYDELVMVLERMKKLKILQINKSFALKISRKIIDFERKQDEGQRGIMFSGILNILKENFVVEDEVLNQIAVNFIRKIKLDNGGIRLIYEYCTALNIKASFELNQQLVWAYLEPQKEKDLGLVVKDIEKDYKVKIKVNPAYFESFMQRSKDFSTVNTLYIAMIRHNVEPSRSTFYIMLKKVIEKEYIEHKDIWRVINIVKERDRDYLPDLFELMISKKLHDNSQHLNFIIESIHKNKVQLKDELIVQVFHSLLRRRKYDLDAALREVKGIKAFGNINFSLLIRKISDYEIARKIEAYLLENNMEVSEEIKRVLLWMTPFSSYEQLAASPTIPNLQIRKLKDFTAKKKFYQQLKEGGVAISDFIYYELVSSAPFMEGWEFYQEIKEQKEKILQQSQSNQSWANPLFVNQLMEKNLTDWQIRNLLIPELNRTQVGISEYWFERLTNVVWEEDKDLELWTFIKKAVQEIKIMPTNALYDQIVNLEKSSDGSLKSKLEKFLGQAKDLVRTKILLRLMEEKGLTPTKNVVIRLIKNFDAEEQFKKVVSILTSSGLTINEEELLIAQFKLSTKEKQLILFDKIWALREEQGRLNIESYYALIEIFDFDKSFEIYKQMLASGISYQKLKTKELLTNLAEKEGCREEGIKLVEEEAQKAKVKSEAIYLKLMRYAKTPAVLMAYLDSMIKGNMVVTTRVEEQLVRSYQKYKRVYQDDKAFQRLEEKFEEIRKKKKNLSLTDLKKSDMNTDDALKLLEAKSHKIDYKYWAVLMSKPQTFEDAQKIHERIKAKHVHEVKEDFFENFLLHAKSFEDAFFILKASRQALSTTSLSLFERVFYNWVDNYNDGYQLFEMLSVLPKIESKYLSICVDLLGLYEGTFQEDSIEKVFAYLEHFPYRSSNKVLKNYAEKCINLIGRIPSVKLAKKFFHLMTTYLGPVHIPLDKALFPIQRESDPGICLGYLFTIRLSLPGKSVSPEMIADIACNKVNSVENAKSFVKVYHPKFNGLEVKPETKACLAKFQIYL